MAYFQEGPTIGEEHLCCFPEVQRSSRPGRSRKFVADCQGSALAFRRPNYHDVPRLFLGVHRSAATWHLMGRIVGGSAESPMEVARFNVDMREAARVGTV